MAEISKTVVICNARGLHARAAAKFVKTCEGFNADVTVEKGGMRVDGCSIMDLMMLGASQDTEIKITATGADADKVVESLAALVCEKFGESE